MGKPICGRAPKAYSGMGAVNYIKDIVGTYMYEPYDFSFYNELDGDSLVMAIKFRVFIYGIGEVCIHANEIGTSIGKRRPTWKVWVSETNDPTAKPRISPNLSAVGCGLQEKFSKDLVVGGLTELVERTQILLNTYIESGFHSTEGERRKSLSTYYTAVLGVPVKVLSRAGETTGTEGTSDIFLSLPVFGYPSGIYVAEANQKLPIIITGAMVYDRSCKLKGIRSVQIQAGHYTEGLEPFGTLRPRYDPKDKTKSRTNVYLELKESGDNWRL